MTSNLRELVGSTAVIATILQFLSGILVCKQYVVKRSTSDTSSLPFICGLTSCALWLQYGLLKQDSKIILVNAIGGILSLTYSIIFYWFTIKKSHVLKQLLVATVFLAGTVIYWNNETDRELLLRRLGWLACCLTLVFIAAPLSKLLHVVRVQSCACLPFPMILTAFVVSVLWFTYGVIIEDPFLQLPNFIGAVLSASQLTLFVIYPSRSLPASKNEMAIA